MATVTSPEAYKLIHDGALALSQVEANGMRVDTAYLEKTITDTDEKIARIGAQLRKDPVFKAWKKRFGDSANIDSREQLGTILFDVMKVPYTWEPTASGRYKVDEEILNKVGIPFCKEWLGLQKLNKVRSTYLEGIRREIVDGYLHPFFNLHTTVTFRSSADSPNFQNIPVRDPAIAEIVRRCFVARKGRHVVEIDYSGIEVRIAACYNKDPNLVKYIKDPTTDMHRDTAAQLFFLDQEFLKENKDWAKRGPRDWAKNRFVFPQFYGSVYFQCAPHLWEAFGDGAFKLPDGTPLIDHMRRNGVAELGDCNPKESPSQSSFAHHVRNVERSFWDSRFKVYAKWKKDWWSRYLDEGGFTTFTGFRINGVFKRNDVINYPVQGCAFHCLLMSLTLLQRWLVKHKMKSKIVGQIHDSIVLDVHPDELDDVLQTAKHIMTVVVPRKWKWITVPLEVEADVAPIGATWHDKKQVKI